MKTNDKQHKLRDVLIQKVSVHSFPPLEMICLPLFCVLYTHRINFYYNQLVNILCMKTMMCLATLFP